MAFSAKFVYNLNMDHSIQATYFSPKHKGTIATADTVFFSTDQVGGEDSGVIIYDEHNQSYRFSFSKKGCRGCLYGLKINMAVTKRHSYLFFQGNETFIDQNAKIILGNSIWGQDQGNPIRGGFYLDDFDWEDDEYQNIPYSESIIYGLHVRNFTMHRSSGVKKKGTFAGICEKIPYLRDLGVTALLLMPAYDFAECETVSDKKNGNGIMRLNCWGFKESFYYAPKSAFAGDNRPDHAFKSMVKTLHQSGIEVYMYFYFPPEFSRVEIIDVLRFWVVEYHLDGVYLLGVSIPIAIITQDSILSGTKIIYNEYAYGENQTWYGNTGIMRDHFMTEVRQLLKSDEDKINAFLYHHRNLLANRGSINYLADYGGFSLFDMTAYDKKRNELNGEGNQDGTDHNHSWNCGIEGPSRKKNVVALRTKQVKNALSLLFLAQGTPFMFSGDEFGNTRFGNNNAYCQDNEIGWIKWADNNLSRTLLGFTKELIAFRKNHPILHMDSELKILDWQRCGFPDISYHGEAAWRPDLTPYSRAVGMMLCGRYAQRDDESKDDFIFIAINMHWLGCSLALPNLPKGLTWSLVYSTDERKPEMKVLDHSESIMMFERSVCVLISSAVED